MMAPYQSQFPGCLSWAESPAVGAHILDQAAQRRFAILVTSQRSLKVTAETGFAVINGP